MNPTPIESALPTPLASRLADTRRVPLDALKTRALIGAETLPAPEPRGAPTVCAFNASL